MFLKTFEIHDRNYGLIDTVRACSYRTDGEQYVFYGAPLVMVDRQYPGPILRRVSRKQTFIQERRSNES